MQITLRTISNKTFKVEANASITVAELKTRVIEASGDLPLDALKLVYKGKVLSDTDTLESSNYVPEGFIVVFFQPVKAATAAAAAPPATPVTAPPSSSAAPTTPAPVSSSEETPAAPTKAPPSSASPHVPETPTVNTSTSRHPDTPVKSEAASPAAAAEAQPAETFAHGGAGTFLSGEKLEAAIQGICEMGFPREEVQRAMRAAFNNPDRAVEYLSSGFPEDVLMTEASAQPVEAAPAVAPAVAPPAAEPFAPVSAFAETVPAPAAAAPPTLAPAATAAVPSGGPTGEPFNMFAGPGAQQTSPALEYLQNHPGFQAMRRTIRSNPELAGSMLQELGRHDPRLIRLIEQNQHEFLRLLSRPDELDEEDDEAVAGLLGLGSEEGPGSGLITVELTPDDEAKLQRLEELGFDRDACIEAYLACDRNFELAANMLAESMLDD